MSPARQRLAARAAADYPAALLAQIAQAALPAYPPGTRLGDRQIKQVAQAVDVLASAGHDARSARALIASHQQTGGQRWRERLWAEALQAASRRPAPGA